MNILFLCVANSARSQMAEGIARRELAGIAEIYSAGSNPGKVNPFAVAALAEIGIDISSQYSKSIADIDLPTMDLIITLCAEEVCPFVPGKTEKQHWPFPDPASSAPEAQQKADFQRVRDGILARIRAFKQTIPR